MLALDKVTEKQEYILRTHLWLSFANLSLCSDWQHLSNLSTLSYAQLHPHEFAELVNADAYALRVEFSCLFCW